MARAKADNDTTFEAVGEAAESMGDRARAGAATAADLASELAGKASAASEAASEAAADIAQDVSARLKAVGIDTEVMAGAAKDQLGGLRQMLADEMQSRPLRTLGLAAAAGIVLGFLSSR
ncbi:hypothetical protein [Phreatobacter cathodiphilus]|uniref:DUF883 domain-containing protein n=1 Tax=Phreatobacter cathodiphilus TaxID=1868589 RepID=A0A2S0NGL7_9HYPH|nr:hypothetical protein [Phreatobacter cathodiphilus]AVO47186.1 hypothetical protein C6569_20240 [Phreatobacter cathodiphilus]